MTDSLPRSQQRPPDSEEEAAPTSGAPAFDDASAQGEPEEAHEEQPGFPEGPVSPAEGGD